MVKYLSKMILWIGEWITLPSIEYSWIFPNNDSIHRSMAGLPEPITSQSIENSGIFINSNFINRSMSGLPE